MVESTSVVRRDHPAKYSAELLPEMTQMLSDLLGTPGGRLLDPMAGTGRAARVAEELGMSFTGVELEPEWAQHHPEVIVGDAARLPFADDTFRAIVVSPAYGNRMADSYAGSPADRERLRNGARRIRRLTYRIYLERPLTDGNGAAMQWGSRYRSLHGKAWAEAVRVLEPGGAFVLNIKNHQRAGREIDVAGWHSDVLADLGLQQRFRIEVGTSHYRQGANCDARFPELLIGFTRPSLVHAATPSEDGAR